MIHSIKNNSGQNIQLWRLGNKIANLRDGESIKNISNSITSVSRAGVIYHHRVGLFLNNEKYNAIFSPNTIKFTGDKDTPIVRFN